MRVKKYLALIFAAILATTMLTACPWDIEDDTASDSSGAPSSSSRPSDDEDDDPVMYTVTASVIGEAGGTVSVIPASVAAGGSVTVTITPEDNYQLASVTDNGDNVTASVTSNNTYTLSNVTVNHTITVTFKLAIDPDDPATWETVDTGNGKTIIVPQGADLTKDGLVDNMLKNDVNSVDLSESGITSIPAKAFFTQNDLVSITVLDGTEVEEEAFLSCPMLQTVNGTLGNVGQKAFGGCRSLTSIKVNGNVEAQAFDNCTKLSKAWIMGSVGRNPFAGCTSLQHLWVSTEVNVNWRGVITGWLDSLQDGQNPPPGVPPTSPEDDRNLQVHYDGPQNDFFENQFKNISEDNFWFCSNCDGSDWTKITSQPALNSGLASLLLGL